MSAGYREYLELFEYFGRGGMVRLGREEYEMLAEEFEVLVAANKALSETAISRVMELKAALFRDRPRLAELQGKGRQH